MSVSNEQSQLLHQVCTSLLNKAGYSYQHLQRAAHELSEAYRAGRPLTTLLREEHILSYIAVRMPATYAVVCRVLNMIPSSDKVTSLMDFGSGPGTVIWAASAIFPHLTRVIAIEQEPKMVRVAQDIASHFLPAHSLHIEWNKKLGDETMVSSDMHTLNDVVVMSYVLGEMNASQQHLLLQQAFSHTKQFLVIIEPGTPCGFQVIHSARQFLLQMGGFTIAPCTHDQPCPIAAQFNFNAQRSLQDVEQIYLDSNFKQANDWCHFSERLERSHLHRFIKGAELMYEDEKYSYIIIAKETIKRQYQARIIKQPIRRSGHVRLDLCAHGNITKTTISKKNKELYHDARHLNWGDGWNKTV